MDVECNVCRHEFLTRHLEPERRQCTWDEFRRRKCDDCIDCHPPEDAKVRERDRELVDA